MGFVFVSNARFNMIDAMHRVAAVLWKRVLESITNFKLGRKRKSSSLIWT